jgi:hypothetical protein
MSDWGWVAVQELDISVLRWHQHPSLISNRPEP